MAKAEGSYGAHALDGLEDGDAPRSARQDDAALEPDADIGGTPSAHLFTGPYALKS
jgi:hypothetical protein